MPTDQERQEIKDKLMDLIIKFNDAQLAAKLEVNTSTIFRWTSKGIYPNPKNLKDINKLYAKHFGKKGVN